MPDVTIALRHDEIFEIFTDQEQQTLETLCTHLSLKSEKDYFHTAIMAAVDNTIKDLTEGRMPRPGGDVKFSLHFVDPSATDLQNWAKEMGVTPMEFVIASIQNYQTMLLAVRNDQHIEIVTPAQAEKREPFEMSWP